MTNKASWKFNHTQIRVKDPERSIKYYELLGLSLLNKVSVPDSHYDEYFLGYNGPKSVSTGAHWSDREGVVKLHHDHGTEKDPSFTVNNGNADPGKGWGHLCISVDNIQAACKRIEDAGYDFKKRLTDGRMKHIAFALDPDGYWVEVTCHQPVAQAARFDTTDPSAYRMNHTMMRVKDKDASVRFYQDHFGMELLRTLENKDNAFNLYFLGYMGDYVPDRDLPDEVSALAKKEGLLELTWNYGTEKEEGPVYHNGNTDPKGYSNITVSVDDLEAACKELEGKDVKWQKKLSEGSPSSAVVLDPDNYWVEIIQNQGKKQTAHP